MKLLMMTRRVDLDDPRAGFSYRWITEFARHCETVVVLCLVAGTTTGLPANCRVIAVRPDGVKRRARDFFRLQRLAMQEIRSCDAVFTHQNPEYGIALAPWCILYRKKIMAWYVHGAVTWKLNLLAKLVSTIITASKDSCRIDSTKVVVLQHGIDTELFSLKSEQPHQHRLVTIGRVSPTKRIRHMIEMVTLLRDSGMNDISLMIVGGAATAADKHYQAELEALVSRHNLASQVTFAGAISHPQTVPFYQMADLMLNFSSTGSIDKAVLEAMSCGTPVLTTNEAFRDMAHTFPIPQFDSNNSPRELAGHAARILEKTDRAFELSLREYVVTHHSLPILIQKILALYGA